MRSSLAGLCAASVLAGAVPAHAQDKNILVAELAEADICKPLKFDIKEAADQLGLPLSFVPPGLDLKVGWDVPRHRVETFAMDSDRKMTALVVLGCQPGGDGFVVKSLGLEADALRLTQEVLCTATVPADVSKLAVDCEPTGVVGRLLEGVTDLNVKVAPAFRAALASV